MNIKYSGRSTDFISPDFAIGCLYQCAYCYMKRHTPSGLTINPNVNKILKEIHLHSQTAQVEKPNQTHESYITYDISCNEDFSLHLKYHKDWKKIFDFFVFNPNIMASFATKYVNLNLLDYNPNKKIRIRFSLMPQIYSTILEPNTSLISDRIKAINIFIEAGYDVHVNFSPVILENKWLFYYEKLFKELNDNVNENYKHLVKAEVIFLTHNKEKHEYNIANNVPGEHLLWSPNIQEDKISQFGGKNLRYNYILKAKAIKQFIELHDKIIVWNKIRYIF